MKRLIEMWDVPINEYEMAEETKKGISQSEKDSDPVDEKNRVQKSELELCYFRNPLAFNSINKITQVIVTSKQRLVHPDKKIVKFFEDYLDTLGTRGGDCDWRQLFELIIRYPLVYGDCPIEYIQDKNSSKIMDLTYIDPKQVDYAKSGAGVIVLDDYGVPVGFTQTLPSGVKVPMPKNLPPEVVLKPNQIFLPYENIAYFKLWTVGNGFYGIGLIEPAYESIKTTMNLNKDYAQRAHTILFPQRVARVGDLNHRPSPEMLNNIVKKMRETTARSEMAVPYYVDIAIKEAKNPDSMNQFLDYFNRDTIRSTGIPYPYATGESQNTNKASLNKINQFFELSIHDYVARACNKIEREIFKKIADSYGLKGYPMLKIGPIGVEETADKFTRLMGYLNAGVFSPSSPMIRKYISDIEDLEFYDESTKPSTSEQSPIQDKPTTRK
jgi:hypothetical protein